MNVKPWQITTYEVPSMERVDALAEALWEEGKYTQAREVYHLGKAYHEQANH